MPPLVPLLTPPQLCSAEGTVKNSNRKRKVWNHEFYVKENKKEQAAHKHNNCGHGVKSSVLDITHVFVDVNIQLEHQEPAKHKTLKLLKLAF